MGDDIIIDIKHISSTYKGCYDLEFKGKKQKFLYNNCFSIKEYLLNEGFKQAEIDNYNLFAEMLVNSQNPIAQEIDKVIDEIAPNCKENIELLISLCKKHVGFNDFRKIMIKGFGINSNDFCMLVYLLFLMKQHKDDVQFVKMIKKAFSRHGIKFSNDYCSMLIDLSTKVLLTDKRAKLLPSHMIRPKSAIDSECSFYVARKMLEKISNGKIKDIKIKYLLCVYYEI